MKKNLTCNKINEMMRDEKKGEREYLTYGLNSLARDEKGHYNFLSKLKKKIKCE